MKPTIQINYDDPDSELYAANCGLVSKLAEEMKYRAEYEEKPSDVLAKLETMEFEYWNEADNSADFWEDRILLDTDEMSDDEIKQTLLEILPSLPRMSYQSEIEMISNL